jgi:fructoselysine-6-P-deglycase FrlB-like protein
MNHEVKAQHSSKRRQIFTSRHGVISHKTQNLGDLFPQLQECFMPRTVHLTSCGSSYTLLIPAAMALARNANHNHEYHVNCTENELSARQSKGLKPSRLMPQDVKLRRGNYYLITEFKCFIRRH